MKINEIQNIAVVGLGRMGHGIAQTFAMAGYSVRGFDHVEAVRSTTLDRVRSNLVDFAGQNMLEEDADAILSRITVAESEESAVEGAHFVVEAIVEERDAKRAWFKRMEALVDSSTILASNSSTCTISLSGSALRFPDRAVVTHWFNPPHIVPTVEVVPGPKTSEEVTEVTIALHQKIGKLAVRINGEIPGFLVNRIQIALIREVWDLYERGIASPEDIDTAVRGSIGFRLANFGPLAICDFGGLDLWEHVYKQLAPDIRSDIVPPETISDLVASGRDIYREDKLDPEGVIADRNVWMLQLSRLLKEREGLAG